MPSRRELEIRNQINHIFLTASDEEMFSDVLNLIQEAIQCQYGLIGYFNEKGHIRTPAVTRGVYPDQCTVADRGRITHRKVPGGIHARALEAGSALYDNTGSFQTPPGHVSIVNTLVAPIVYHSQSIGFISLANKKDGYGGEDQRLLETMASIIAPILHGRLERKKQEKARRKAEKALQKRNQELTILNEMAELMTRSLDLQEVLDIALNKTMSLFNAEGGLIFLFDGADVSLLPRASNNISPEMLEEISTFHLEGLSGKVAASGKPIIVPDLRKDSRNKSAVAVRDGWRSFAATSIRERGKLSGVMVLVSRQVNHFDPDAEHILASIGIQIGPSIENASLYNRLQEELLHHKETAEALRRRKQDSDDYFNKSLDMLCFADMSGVLQRVNPAWERTLGYPISDVEGKKILKFVHPDDVEPSKAAMRKIGAGQRVMNYVNRCRHRDGHYIYIETNAYASGDIIYAVARDVSKRKRLEQEREELIAELQQALADVKKLSGLLPICSLCKKIRDDKGYWKQIESYISEHSEADFSHGICPECAKALYPKYYRGRRTGNKASDRTVKDKAK